MTTRLLHARIVAGPSTRAALRFTAMPQLDRRGAPLYSLAKKERRVARREEFAPRTNSKKGYASALVRGDGQKAVAVVGATTDESLPVFQIIQKMADEVVMREIATRQTLVVWPLLMVVMVAG